MMKPVLLVIAVGFLTVTQLNPIYPREQFLQNVPTAVALLVLAVDCWQKFLTRTAYVCTIAFFGLHIFGARYIYSMVPYDDWLNQLWGVTTVELFGFQRNHFDRLVHFLFGWLYLLAAYSTLREKLASSVLQNLFLSFCIVTALSGIYEVFEWCLTMVMSPHDADSYNGQQGDNWDAQKDMALAMLGSMLAVPWILLFLPKQHADSTRL